MKDYVAPSNGSEDLHPTCSEPNGFFKLKPLRTLVPRPTANELSPDRQLHRESAAERR
jgi:hypothetical protein